MSLSKTSLIKCGSEPARECNLSVNRDVDLHSAFASRLAPTVKWASHQFAASARPTPLTIIPTSRSSIVNGGSSRIVLPRVTLINKP